MIIHNFYIFSTCLRPPKADAPLIIDADTVLTGPVAFQCLKPVSGWNPQIIQTRGDFQLPQLAASNFCNVDKTAYTYTFCQGFRVSALERLDHAIYSNAPRD